MPALPRRPPHLKLSHLPVFPPRSTPIRLHNASSQTQRTPTVTVFRNARSQFSSSSKPVTPSAEASVDSVKKPPHVPIHEPLPIKSEAASLPIISIAIVFQPKIPIARQLVISSFIVNFMAKGFAGVEVTFKTGHLMIVEHRGPLFVRSDSLSESGKTESSTNGEGLGSDVGGEPAEENGSGNALDPWRWEKPIVDVMEAARSDGLLDRGQVWLFGAMGRRSD